MHACNAATPPPHTQRGRVCKRPPPGRHAARHPPPQPGTQSQEREAAKPAILSHLAALEDHLPRPAAGAPAPASLLAPAAGGGGGGPTLADVAVACALLPLWEGVLGADVRGGFPKVDAWLQSVAGHAAFVAVTGARRSAFRWRARPPAASGRRRQSLRTARARRACIPLAVCTRTPANTAQSSSHKPSPTARPPAGTTMPGGVKLCSAPSGWVEPAVPAPDAKRTKKAGGGGGGGGGAAAASSGGGAAAGEGDGGDKAGAQDDDPEKAAKKVRRRYSLGRGRKGACPPLTSCWRQPDRPGVHDYAQLLHEVQRSAAVALHQSARARIGAPGGVRCARQGG